MSETEHPQPEPQPEPQPDPDPQPTDEVKAQGKVHIIGPGEIVIAGHGNA